MPTRTFTFGGTKLSAEDVYDDPSLFPIDESAEGAGSAGAGSGGSGFEGMSEEELDLHNSRIETSLSDFAQAVLRIPDEEGVFGAFSFRGRRHMPPIYDTPAKDLLLVCGRQVEKCVSSDTTLLRPNGSRMSISDCKVGDPLVTLSGDANLQPGEVLWVSKVIKKEAVRIRTRKGHELVCATTHPIRQWNRWTPAGQLTVGERIACMRQFNPPSLDALARTGGEPEETHRLAWTAAGLFVQPRSWSKEQLVLVCKTKTIKQLLQDSLDGLGYVEGLDYGWERRKPTTNPQLTLFSSRVARVMSWVGELEKGRIPGWVYDLDLMRLKVFVRFLWAAGGKVYTSNLGLKNQLRIDDTRKELLLDVQALLWKIGVPTSLSWVMGCSWSLQVDTSRGVQRLEELLCAEQKPELATVPVGSPSQDLFPPEVVEDIRAILLEKDAPSQRQLFPGDGHLRNQPMSWNRLALWVERMRLYRVNPHLLARLESHLKTDLYWDPIESIEKMPAPVPCMDIEVSKGHSFIGGGILSHNSTFLGNRALSLCALIPGYKVLYVSPSSAQTKSFSGDRLRLPIETSPVLKKLTTGTTQNVLEKVFTNGSQIVLRAAYLSADRVRGQAAYMLLLDEIQDLLKDHIPVIEPATSHAPKNLRIHCYSGTPKSRDNHIEHLRSGRNGYHHMSTMGEWMVPCDRCGSAAKGGPGRFWQCLGEKNIGRKGLICSRCGQLLDPQTPDAGWYHQHAEGEYESYRIPQLMVGWRDWKRILKAYDNYPPRQFYNEVLGLSLDDADRPLTEAEMEACSDPRITMTARFPGSRYMHPEDFTPDKWDSPVFAGIDWGMGISTGFTVITLGTYIEGRFTIFYAHRFTGMDAADWEGQLARIVELLNTFQVKVCGTDFGFGVQLNDRLLRIFGPGRIQVFHYLGRAKRKVEYEPKIHRTKLFRTMVMADLINAIKRRNVGFPRTQEFFDPYAKDFCNITAEYSETQRMLVYDHSASTTDDTFHSFAYCFLASQSMIRRPDIITPMAVGTPGQHPIITLPGPIDQGLLDDVQLVGVPVEEHRLAGELPGGGIDRHLDGQGALPRVEVGVRENEHPLDLLPIHVEVHQLVGLGRGVPHHQLRHLLGRGGGQAVERHRAPC